MKKAKIFALSLAMLMLASAFVIPASAVDTSLSFHVTDATFTADGVMGADEGWSETPLVVLDSQGAEDAPEVYASTDGEYLYIFFDAKGKIIHEAFLFVQLGTENKNSNANGKDKFVYPRIKVKCSGNDQVTCGSYNYLTTGKTDGAAFSGITWGESADFTAVEFKIPLSDDFKSKLVEDDQEIKLGCLIREWNPDGTDSNDVNNYKKEYKNSTYGFDWTNAKIPVTIPVIPESTVEADSSFFITDATFTADGVMGTDEGWSEAPLTILDSSDSINAPVVYGSTDRENLYIFFDAKGKVVYEVFLMIAIGDVNKLSSVADSVDRFVYARVKGTCSGSDTLNANNGGLNYLASKYDHTAFSKSTWTVSTDNTAAEFIIPIPDDLKTALATGDQSFKVSCMIREANSDNSGYTAEHTDKYGFDWNNAKTPVSISQTPYVPNSDIVVEGLQDRVEADGLTDVRFLASLKGDYQDYEALGFEFGYQEHNATANCKYVYTSIKAGDDLVTPDLYEADYFFCYTIYNLSAGDYTFTVRSWSQKEGESKSYSDAAVFVFTVEENGSITVEK